MTWYVVNPSEKKEAKYDFGGNTRTLKPGEEISVEQGEAMVVQANHWRLFRVEER